MAVPTLKQRIESLAKTFGRVGNNQEYTGQQVSEVLFRELKEEQRFELTEKARQALATRRA